MHTSDWASKDERHIPVRCIARHSNHIVYVLRRSIFGGKHFNANHVRAIVCTVEWTKCDIWNVFGWYKEKNRSNHIVISWRERVSRRARSWLYSVVLDETTRFVGNAKVSNQSVCNCVCIRFRMLSKLKLHMFLQCVFNEHTEFTDAIDCNYGQWRSECILQQWIMPNADYRR